METQTQEQGLDVALIIENSIPVLQTAADVLKANSTLRQKALIVGQNILATYNEKGLSPELDERAMKFLGNVSTAMAKMKEDRSGITQIMDELKKMYTLQENELDPKKAGTIPFQVQSMRNNYAKQVAEEKEKKRQEEERIANKKKEAIEIKSEFSKSYTNQYFDYLSARKKAIMDAFNSIKLEDFEKKEAALKDFSPSYQFKHSGLYTSKFKYHKDDEIKAFVDATIIEKDSEFEANYLAEINLLKDELVDKLPSKLAELQEEKRLADEAEQARKKAELERIERQKKIDEANAEEKKRLEKEAEEKRIENEKKQAELKKEQERLAEEKRKREQEENERIERETNDRIAENQQKEDLKAQGEQTMVMFEKEAALADDVEAPEARQGFEITVLHPVGFTQIFALWFEKVGKDLPVDKIGNTKLDQMKAWAEKEAHKNGTKIESKFIKYEPTYKAVTRKS